MASVTRHVAHLRQLPSDVVAAGSGGRRASAACQCWLPVLWSQPALPSGAGAAEPSSPGPRLKVQLPSPLSESGPAALPPLSDSSLEAAADQLVRDSSGGPVLLPAGGGTLSYLTSPHSGAAAETAAGAGGSSRQQHQCVNIPDTCATVVEDLLLAQPLSAAANMGENASSSMMGAAAAAASLTTFWPAAAGGNETALGLVPGVTASAAKFDDSAAAPEAISPSAAVRLFADQQRCCEFGGGVPFKSGCRPPSTE